MKYLLAFLLLALPAHWTVDTTVSKVSFSVHGPFGRVQGTLSGLTAEIDFDPKAPANGSLKASVDVKTIKTGVDKRDHDLCRESAWFDADKYPRITFVSHKISGAADTYKADGELTIKGVTKPLTVPFTFDGKVFRSHFSLNREDYHLGKGPVGNLVTVDLSVAVHK